MRTTIPIIGPGVQGRSIHVNPQRSVNLYPVLQGPGAKNQIVLHSTPGLPTLATAGTGPIRSGTVTFQGLGYFVSGYALYSIDTLDVTALIGSIGTGYGPVSVVAGRDYLMLVDGVAGYTYDGTTFAQISDADFPNGATRATYLDSYFIVNTGVDDEAYISPPENPTSWAALDFTTAEAAPDDVLAVAANRNDLYLIGSNTTEVYYNSGNVDFPFDVYPNGVLEYGIAAKHSVAVDEGRLFMLAATDQGQGIVAMINGLAGQVISDNDIAWQISQLSHIEDAEGWTYKQAGQTFYVLNFPVANKTFAYHVEEGSWHERSTFGLGRWRASWHGFFNKKNIVGDYSTGTLYTLDHGIYTDAGATLRRERVTKVYHKDRRRLQCSRFEVEFEPGVGLITGQGSDPQAMLRYSVDGGRTWSSELWQPIGKIGEYEARAVWHRLGVGRQYVFELAVTDPVKMTVIGAYVDVEVLAA